MSYTTLKLDKTWDVSVDGAGNLAIASGPESLAQDVASACGVFSGECWYDNTLGIPWKEDVLGKHPTAGFVAQKLQNEARKLAVVRDALATVALDKSARRLRGILCVTDNEGNEVQLTL